MGKILDNINSPQDIKKLSNKQLEILAGEIREFLIESVSKTGGHLASNLGIVEITLAIHRVFNSPQDKIIWDVGHQSYVHKILTGRRDKFSTLRQFGGISGFPKTCESEYDCFNTGHSSTSISAALGFAKSRDLKGENYHVIAVIGDGALTGGMAFEALNDAGRSPNNLIVILNDNEMSIAKNVGGMSKYLSRLRTQPAYFRLKEDTENLLKRFKRLGIGTKRLLSGFKDMIKYAVMPSIIFEQLGFKYIGPIDGHDISQLEEYLENAKKIKGPVFIHICTQKGKGYEHAEKKPDVFHGIAPFEVETGEVLKSGGSSFSKEFGKNLSELADKNNRIIAITAAMRNGTGLDTFYIKHSKRFYDVGIAEQHAVTFAAGMAQNGMIPVFAVYSSFLQRAYDQVLHDVAMQNLHVVFCIDRAGTVGEDGESHQGLYDISFLSHIPNMTIMAPSDYTELAQMLNYAINEHKGPIALRYPRGGGKKEIAPYTPIELGKGVLYKTGRDVTVVALGNMLETAIEVDTMLIKAGISSEIINARFAKPIDIKLIMSSVLKTGNIAVIEDGTIVGGFGSNIVNHMYQNNIKAKSKLFAFPDEFITHGRRSQILQHYRMDSRSIADRIINLVTG